MRYRPLQSWACSLRRIEWLGYTRVSRVGDRAERLISPELQAERIEAYAAGRGITVRMLEPELDVSGGKVERPILGAAIEAVERGEAAGIIVAQLDRLSRMDIADALATIRRIEGAGGQVIAVAENFDAGTPEGRLARNMMLALGEMQLDRYRAQFRSAKERAVRQGIWPMPIIPLGYVKGPDRRLVPGPEAPRVRRAFELRAGGASWRIICDHLTKGISGAAKTIRNRVYLGEIRLGEWVNTDAHPPIVERDLWEAAQVRGARPPRRKDGRPALLGGLIRCTGCGFLMSPQDNSYRCCSRKARGRCPNRANITRAGVDAVVERTVLAHLEGITLSGTPSTDALDAARERLSVTEAELAAYQQVTSALEGGFEAGLRARAEAVKEARAELAQARLLEPARSSVDAVALWPTLSIEQRRHVLRGALSVVWVTRGKGLGRVQVVEAGFPVEWSEGRLPGEIGLLLPED